MFKHLVRCGLVFVIMLSGCNSYKGLVKPVPRWSTLSPELENLTDAKIETYLRADVRPAFPTVMAVAKVVSDPYSRDAGFALETLHSTEAEGWRRMSSLQASGGSKPISQIQLVNRLLAGDKLSLKSLRDAAALLHAPLLLVYIQDDDAKEGYNGAAIAYWSIVGLFVVPGNDVGHYSVCQGVLVDTRSGFILSTIEGEGHREEHVLAGAVDIARRRTNEAARCEAVMNLQKEIEPAILNLTQSPTSQGG
jgi:hypothetical protein